MPKRSTEPSALNGPYTGRREPALAGRLPAASFLRDHQGFCFGAHAFKAGVEILFHIRFPGSMVRGSRINMRDAVVGSEVRGRGPIGETGMWREVTYPGDFTFTESFPIRLFRGRASGLKGCERRFGRTLGEPRRQPAKNWKKVLPAVHAFRWGNARLLRRAKRRALQKGRSEGPDDDSGRDQEAQYKGKENLIPVEPFDGPTPCPARMPCAAPVPPAPNTSPRSRRRS